MIAMMNISKLKDDEVGFMDIINAETGELETKIFTDHDEFYAEKENVEQDDNLSISVSLINL